MSRSSVGHAPGANEPTSGDPSASYEDRDTTAKVMRAAKLVEMLFVAMERIKRTRPRVTS